MKQKDLRRLKEHFDTIRLLSAIDNLDEVRGALADGDSFAPPVIRSQLLTLHQLAMNVVNNGWTEQADEMFMLADDLGSEMSDMIEALENIQKTLDLLTHLHPENAEFFDPDQFQEERDDGFSVFDDEED